MVTYFRHKQCFICRFLVFSFLVFSVYKNLKSDYHLLFHSILVQFYVCQACKLYFYFGYVQNYGQYLYSSILSKQWKCPSCMQLLLKIRCSHCTQNCLVFFSTFLYVLAKPLFCDENILCLCIYFVKKTAQLILEKLS